MPEVFFNGPAGRLEGRFHPAKQRGAPIAVVLHPHPQFGGNMHDSVLAVVSKALLIEGVDCLRFNFRGVGNSAGQFDDDEDGVLGAFLARLRRGGCRARLCP